MKTVATQEYFADMTLTSVGIADLKKGKCIIATDSQG